METVYAKRIKEEFNNACGLAGPLDDDVLNAMFLTHYFLKLFLSIFYGNCK